MNNNVITLLGRRTALENQELIRVNVISEFYDLKKSDSQLSD